jgi:uncharacterized protein
MKQKIVTELYKIEENNSVKILFATESGSRAWGFPSNDSDYDVRFIYVHLMDWYLTIDEKRDVIELPIDSVLDISGWDLRKSLRLLRKSNSPLLEWVSSPIQYYVWHSAYEQFSTLSKSAFLPETSCHHYLSMAKNSVEKLESSEKVKLKTYMYAIRPILCCEWIIKNLTQPPMHIADLLAEVSEETLFKDKVFDLIKDKKNNSENYTMARSEVIENYINRKIVALHDNIPKNSKKLDSNKFDEMFRYILKYPQS